MIVILIIIFVALIALLEIKFYVKHAFDRLDIDVHFSQEVANYGDTIEVVETAQNNKRLPLPFLILKFESPVSIQFKDMTNIAQSDYFYREDMLVMQSFSRHTRRIKAECTARGYFNFARVSASTSDLFLIKKIYRDYTPNSGIIVLPRIISSDELKTLLQITFSETFVRRTLLTDPFAFSGIREYQPWDPMNTINWTASAKAGDFMVNQTASTANRHVNLFLNLDFYNTKHSTSLLEISISLAYSYIRDLVSQGITVSLYCNGLDIISSTPLINRITASETDLTKCGIELARVDLKQEVLPLENVLADPSVREDSGDLNVIISPNYSEDFQSILSYMLSQRMHLLWVMPCYKNDIMSHKMIPSDDIIPNFIRWETKGHD